MYKLIFERNWKLHLLIHLFVYFWAASVKSVVSKNFLLPWEIQQNCIKMSVFSLVTIDLHSCHKSNTASRSPSSAIQYNSNLKLSLHSTVVCCFFFFSVASSCSIWRWLLSNSLLEIRYGINLQVAFSVLSWLKFVVL